MESCLKKSIEQYQRILDHAEQLEALLVKADPARLNSYTVRLHELQDEANLHDRVFFELFSRNSAAWKDHPLFRERTRLLEKIVALNHLLLPRIRGMMAVTAHELTQIKGGRVAVSSYHKGDARQVGAVRGVG
jgi:2,3-bisphosphoglycerate-independent phosphoglycerate mutase